MIEPQRPHETYAGVTPPRPARTVNEAVRLAMGTLAPPTRETLGSLAAVDVRSAIRREPLVRKLGRRAITVPAQFIITALWWAVAPIVVPTLAISDALAKRSFARTRFYVWFGAMLFGQVWGGCLLFGCWLFSGFGRAYHLNNRWSLDAERLWARWNSDVMAKLLRIRYQVEGSELLRDGPTILLSRHASTADTILPIGLISSPHGVRLRIVLKEELLWAPIVDAIGHRMPFGFVRRGSTDTARELATCAAITAHMHSQESVLIFPEGTRFTADRRAALIEKLAHKNPEVAAEARALTHVLPLRHPGTLALIEALPQADLVFCAHTGYEGAARLGDFANGAMLGATVRVKFWRIPAAHIPTDRPGRIALLNREWRKVNAFVAANTKQLN